MAVTSDQYELPVYIADTPMELAKIMGLTTTAVRGYVCREQRRYGLKFIKVEV